MDSQESSAALQPLELCIHFDGCTLVCVAQPAGISDVHVQRVAITFDIVDAAGRQLTLTHTHTQTADERIDALFLTPSAKERFERGAATGGGTSSA
jgi:hypothetical protein